jgi:ankyrin repeat protein
MPTLPANPGLDQLRHQARELLRAAKAGDAAAISRIETVSDRRTLAAAQLAIAREYGFASWPKLKDELDARTLDLAEKAVAFCEASISGRMGRAARLFAETPAIAKYSFATAVILGDAARVRDQLQRDPQLATRPDRRSGWTALHAVSASRWHQLEPARAQGLLEVAQALLDAGADPTGITSARPGWSPLRCAIASANSGPSNRGIVELLLVRGAVPNDHDLYLAGFAHDRRELLPLLLRHVSEVPEVARQALAAPISNNDGDSVRTLLEAGADPRRYANDDGQPASALYEATRADCSAELVEILLRHDADPNAPGPDGRSPYRLAVARGRDDLADLLRRNGGHDDTTAGDHLVASCLRADRAEAERQLGHNPGLLDRLTPDEQGALVDAAENGQTDAVALMLDLGFPLETQDGDHGSTPLHAAAYAGSANTVQLLLDRGADVEARDPTWNSTPLDWATVGSGERPTTNPTPDWTETVRILLDAGASIDGITLSPDDPKAPSTEVAELLRARGVKDG